MTAPVRPEHLEQANKIIKDGNPGWRCRYLAQALADAEAKGRVSGIQECIDALGATSQVVRATETVRHALLPLLETT